jgi:hypothetical protein
MVLTKSMAVSPSLRRWLWFAFLYAAGVATMTVVAYGLRALLKLFT